MKIGEKFVKEGLISRDALKKALEEQAKSHERLGDIVLKMGATTPERMSPVLADYFQIPFVNLKSIYKDLKQEIIDAIPAELAHRFNVIPIDIDNSTLIVAIADPLNLSAIDTLSLKTGYFIECVIAPESDISVAIEYCYHNLLRMDTYIDSFIDLNEQIEDIAYDKDEEKFEAGDQPVVQYVKSLIVHAVNSAASDILLQAKQSTADLRFRIDGVLYQMDPPPKVMLSAITTRIKILAGLDIAERRLPQDGRFKVAIGKNTVDIRTSTFPTIYGESVVMRLLDTSQPLLGADQLGFCPKDIKKFKQLIGRSHGLILVTGPTGSGKTTTLYTALNEIKSAQKNIITLEDPVEYRLPFIQQSQVNPVIDFTFSKGLRSILRQDPDIIMVGEIRDKETAEISIHAALTGHLVFSTLHTNDAAGAVVRLINMGIEPFLISSALLAVVAQRLIRIICPDCREEYEEKIDFSKYPDFESSKLYHGKGCPKCMNSGYKGRRGIYELLVVNPTIRKMIVENKSCDEIKAASQKAGMKTLRESGADKLKEGATTLEEVLRITQEIGDDS